MIEIDAKSTGTIVELARARSLRVKPEPAKTVYRCHHLPVTVDPHSRAVVCRDCGATVDPFDWMLAWAKKEETELMAVKGLREERRRLEEDIKGLKRERANAKSSLDRALIAANKAKRGEE